MKFRNESTSTPQKMEQKEDVNLIPDFVGSEEAAQARARLLAAAKQATTVDAPKPASQPAPLEVMDNDRLDPLASTSISTRVDPKEFRARVENNLGEEWVRQDFPSHSVPYDGEEIFLKPFTITVLSRVHAAMKNASFTLLIDALNNCINIDIRDLTPSDWNSMLYWLRMNSYVRTAYTIPWRSKYGNENTHTINESNLEFVELKMSHEEYREWKAKGICFPTVRDMELMETSELSDEDRWRIEYSQYVYVPKIYKPDGTVDHSDYLNRKLEALERGGPAMVEDINDFIKNIEHGVVETVVVEDKLFDPEKAVVYLRESVAETRKMLEAILASSDDKKIEVGMIGMSQRADELELEANLIEQTIKEGKQYIPEKETIELAVNPMHFFS